MPLSDHPANGAAGHRVSVLVESEAGNRPVSQMIMSKQRITLVSPPMPASSRTCSRWRCRAAWFAARC